MGRCKEKQAGMYERIHGVDKGRPERITSGIDPITWRQRLDNEGECTGGLQLA